MSQPNLSSSQLPMSSTHIPNVLYLEQESKRTAPIRWCTCRTVSFLLSLVFLVLVVLAVLPIMFMPPLMVALLAVRFIRFISGDGVINATSKLHIIKGLLFLCMVFSLFQMPIYFTIFKFIPSLKHAMILDLPLPKWVTITCMIFGFYMLGFVLSRYVHAMLLAQLKQYNNYRISVGESFSQIINCLISLWAECEIFKLAPIFKEFKTLSLPTYKWINAAIFALIGCNCITLFTNLVMWLSQQYVLKVSPKLKHVSYYANGIRRSITFVLSSFMLLLIWVFYFGSHLTQVNEPKHILHVGTMTLVTLLICSLLWLLKSCIVLAWEAQAIYSRLLFSKTMFQQLQLLPMIVDYDQGSFSWSEISSVWDLLWVPAMFSLVAADIFPTRMYYAVFESHTEDTTFARKQISLVLLDAKDKLKSTSEGLPESTTNYLLHTLSIYTRNVGDDDKRVNMHAMLKNILELHETNIRDAFKLVLSIHGGFPLDNFPEEMSLGEIKKILNKAISNWFMLANIISTCVEMVDCLDKIMSWAILGATLVIWLILTRLATTKILVIFASPLLAASFIFGDTCKSLFQGIVFVYAVRPFDVGDQCQVGEDSQLQVVSIGVWKTTFSKTQNEGQVEVVYPNSEMANKRVLINRKFNLEELSKQENEKDEFKSDGISHQGSNEAAVTEHVLNQSVITTNESFLMQTRSLSSTLTLQLFTPSCG